jgi:DNA-binding NtrC family response regulator
MSERPFAVAVVDLRMPEMDGMALLYCLRIAAPDTVQVLLTGYGDLDSAVAAVNEGNIFRFLTKPCPAATLLRALEASVEQYRATAECRRNQPPIGREGKHVREDSPC